MSTIHPQYGPCDTVAESECSECSRLIRDYREQIAELELQLKSVKIRLACEKCGAEINDCDMCEDCAEKMWHEAINNLAKSKVVERYKLVPIEEEAK